MFLEQTNQYTITADDYQWVFIWHPAGPVYRADKSGKQDKLPMGKRTYHSSLRSLSAAVVERRARNCDNFADVVSKLDAFMDEAARINRLEVVA